MSYTKRQLIEQAYSEFGLRPGTFSLTPEMMQTALERLDAMMALWNTAQGIRLGYPLPGGALDSDPDQASNIPDVANEPVWTNLAKRLASTIGKALSQDTLDRARDGFNMLASWGASQNIPTMQKTRQTPRGAGNKAWRNGRGVFERPGAAIQAGEDSYLDANDGTGIAL